jgi:hypothetical protein
LLKEYVYATECNLATLAGYYLVKKFSKADKKRQTSICYKMLMVCKKHERKIDFGPRREKYPRVEGILRRSETYYGTVRESLDKWIESLEKP